MLFRFSYQQVSDANGNPLPGAKLYFYASGTSTPKNTYSDQGLTVANSNPVGADAAGRFGPIFLEVGDYKVALHTAEDALVWTSDPEDGAASGTAGQGLSAFKNMLVNPHLGFKQRPATTISDDTYAVDAWYHLNQTGNVTVAVQANQENGQQRNARITQPDVSAKRFGIAQIVENANCIQLRGSPVAFSFRVRSSLAQPIRYAILEWSGSENVVTSDVVLDWTSASWAPGGFFIGSPLNVVAIGSVLPAGGVWTQAPGITGIPSDTMNNLIVFIWTEDAFAQNATLDVGLAQLEPGTEASLFEYQSAVKVVQECYRRYYNFGELDGTFYGAAGTEHNVLISVPVPMVTTPILTVTPSSQINCSGTTASMSAGSTVVKLKSTITAAGAYYFATTLTLDAEL